MIAITPSMGHIAWQTDNQGRQYWDSPSGQRHYRSDQNIYVGYGTNSGLNIQMNDIGMQNGIPYYKPTYNYGNIGTNSTTAYKANVAGTANKIAQGGMTKEDILKYNMKHPNEVAGDNPANSTALNTNTAIRS